MAIKLQHQSSFFFSENNVLNFNQVNFNKINILRSSYEAFILSLFFYCPPVFRYGL